MVDMAIEKQKYLRCSRSFCNKTDGNKAASMAHQITKCQEYYKFYYISFTNKCVTNKK
jgi:hypothetical protein